MVPEASAASVASAELFADVLSCTSFEHVGSRLLAPLASALQATSSTFLQFLDLPYRGHHLGRHCYLGRTPRSIETYAEGAYQLDPLVRTSLQFPRWPCAGDAPYVALLSAVAGWRDSAYDREFLKPFDIGHILGVGVPVGSMLRAEMLCLGFHRPPEAAPFTDLEIARLRSLVPAIQSVLLNLAYREAEALSGLFLETLSDGDRSVGLIALDEDLVVRHANARGMAHLGLDRVAAALPGSPQRSETLGELRERLLRSPLAPSASSRTVLRFTHGGPFGRDVIDVQVRAFTSVDGHPCYLLLTSEDDTAQQLDCACRVYRLSEREIEVARLICAGENNANVARALQIALRTVENHLRSIYAKVGVNSRTQLLTRLLGKH